ncbi:MAG: hypothetical protein ABIH38_05405 [Patescibacteria group bacterium]
MFGLETTLIVLLLFSVFPLIEDNYAPMKEKKRVAKLLFCWLFAFVFTFNYVAYIDRNSAQVENGRVTHIGLAHFGLPARGFLLDANESREFSYELYNSYGVTEKARLTFKCALLDSTGIRGYGLEKTQRYYERVYLPYHGLREYFLTNLNSLNVASDVRQYLACPTDSTLSMIAGKIMAAGQPIDLKYVKDVKIKGGDRS